MPRPVKISIHTEALVHNLQLARHCAPASKIWSVVKANAYGHKIECVYSGLKDTDGFAVRDLEEASILRKLGWHGPILLLEGIFEERDISSAIKLSLTTVIHHEEQLRMMELHRPFEQPIPVYIKMNSGMNRLGFKSGEYIRAWRRLQALPWIGEVSLMTHFSSAGNRSGIDDQLKVFSRLSAKLPSFLSRSLANSAAVLWHPEAHADWIRPGIMLYGVLPFFNANDMTPFALKAAMTLSSQLISVQIIKKGDTLGYDRKFVAQKALRIGIVACGYTDGYPININDGAPIIIEGVRTVLLGGVSMDFICADITDIPQAVVGSPVELWGKNLSINEIISHCNFGGKYYQNPMPTPIFSNSFKKS